MDYSRLHIRRGKAADAEALAGFAARTFLDTFGADNDPAHMQDHLPSSYGIAQQTSELENPDVVTLLAHIDAALVAYAQIQHAPPPAGVTQRPALQLHRFYVDRPAHGRGIAGQLMLAVFNEARAMGARHLWLGVWERNARAIAFYRKHGFIDAGVTAYHVGPDPQTDRVLLADLFTSRYPVALM